MVESDPSSLYLVQVLPSRTAMKIKRQKFSFITDDGCKFCCAELNKLIPGGLEEIHEPAKQQVILAGGDK